MTLKVIEHRVPADGENLYNFTKGKFLRSLITLYDGTEKWERGKPLVINAENYAKGFAL